MSNPVWPAGLPQWMPIETKESSQQNVVSSPMDMGEPKRRQRSTRFSRFLEPPPSRWFFNEFQLGILLDFHDTTLGSGSLRFNWVAPVRSLVGETIECRFVARPDYSMVVPQGTESIYRVSMKVEVMAVGVV